jgi:hypothetical protein
MRASSWSMMNHSDCTKHGIKRNVCCIAVVILLPDKAPFAVCNKSQCEMLSLRKHADGTHLCSAASTYLAVVVLVLLLSVREGVHRSLHVTASRIVYRHWIRL